MSKNTSNVFSDCGGNTASINHAKEVDPDQQAHDTTLGDAVQQDSTRQRPKPQNSSPQICLPIPVRNPCPQQQKEPSSIIQVPCEMAKPCPKFVCEPCPPSPSNVWLIKSNPEPQKVWFNKLLMFLLSVCLPVCGGSTGTGCPVAKLMVCLPCPPPVNMSSSSYPKQSSCSFPFGVPQRAENDPAQKRGGKYLPPPEKRICSPNCIHKSDLKGDRTCTWHAGTPCVAHCYHTPLRH